MHGVPVHRFPSPLRRLISLLGVVALLIAAPALAEKRVALVIGNSAYKHAPALANPKNDAEAMAAALKTLNFEVLLGLDLDKPGMERQLQGFAEKLEKADVALVFYAGHGLMVNGANYLVPIDGKLERESDLLFQAIPADTVQRLLEQAQRVNIIILDACRDNPLARSLARSMGTRSNAVGRGLAPMTAGIGTLIVYATAPGHQALDGEGRNSPFTAALLKHIATPKVEIRDVLTRVRQEVFEATRSRPQPQVPWDTSSLMKGFYLAAAPDAAPPPGPPARPPAADNEALFWQSIKDSKNAADYKAYLAKWPQGVFAELARLRIAEIEKSAGVTPPASEPEKPSPQPAPTDPPERTSTYEMGTWIANRNWVSSVTGIASARTCQVQCLQDARCVAWSWGGTLKTCWLHAVLGAREKSDGIISGVIRTTPAAASPAQPAAPGRQRTSSYERDYLIQGEKIDEIALGAAQCQERCIADSRCVAWHYILNPGSQVCARFSKMTGRVHNPSVGMVFYGVIRTTPTAVQAQPAVPRTGRTSTFAPSTYIYGQNLAFVKNLASPQACQAQCLANPQCVAWTYAQDENTHLERRGCLLIGKVNDVRGSFPQAVSGVVSE